MYIDMSKYISKEGMWIMGWQENDIIINQITKHLSVLSVYSVEQ